MVIDRYIEKELGITHPGTNGPVLRMCAVSVALHVLIAYSLVTDYLAKASDAPTEGPVMVDVMDELPRPVQAPPVKAIPATVPVIRGITGAAEPPKRVVIIQGDPQATTTHMVTPGPPRPVPYQQRRGEGMVAQSVFSNVSSR